jgi:hypothetical protein
MLATWAGGGGGGGWDGGGWRSHRHLLQSLQFKFAAERLEFYDHFVVLKYMYLGVEGCDTRARRSFGVGVINGPRGEDSQLN